MWTAQITNISQQPNLVSLISDYTLLMSLMGNSTQSSIISFADSTFYSQITDPNYPNIIDIRRLSANNLYIVSSLNSQNTQIVINTFPYNPLNTLSFTSPNSASSFLTFGGHNIYWLNSDNSVTLQNIYTSSLTTLNLPFTDVNSLDSLDVGTTSYWKDDTYLYTIDTSTNQITSLKEIPPSTWLDFYFSGPYVLGSTQSGLVYLYSIFDQQQYLSTIPVFSEFYFADLIINNNQLFIAFSGSLLTNYFGVTMPNVYLV